MARETESRRLAAGAAVVLGREGYTCSEAVALVLAPLAGCPAQWALRAAAPFAGGMAGSGGTCGALAAALMLVGLRHGPKDAEDMEARARARELAVGLARRFAEVRGSTLCAELARGYDLAVPEGRLALRESGLPERMIRTAVELAVPLLGADGES